MRKAFEIAIVLFITLVLVCVVVYAAPVKTPYISSLSMTQFTAPTQKIDPITGAVTFSGQSYTVHAYGSGFTNKSVVYFNETPCQTVFISPTNLQFTITAAQLSNLAGTFQIYVFNPGK